MGFGCGGLGWGSWMPWGGVGGLGIIGFIISLLFFAGLLAVLGAGAAWLVRQFTSQGARQETRLDPLEIARRRLAAGDVTVAEFEEIRNRLQG